MSIAPHRQRSPPPQPLSSSRSPRPTAYIPRSSPLAAQALDTTDDDDDTVPKTRTGAKPSRISPPTAYPTPPQTPSPNTEFPLASSSLKPILINSPTKDPTQLPSPPLSPRSSSSNLEFSLRASSTRSSRTRSPFAAPPVFKAHPSVHHDDTTHHVRWSDRTTEADTRPTYRSPSTAPNPAAPGSSTSSRRPSTYVPVPIHGNIPTPKPPKKPTSEATWLNATGSPQFTRAWTAGITMPAKAKGSSSSTEKSLKPSASTSNIISETTQSVETPRPLRPRRAVSEPDGFQGSPKPSTMPVKAGRPQASSLREMITAEEAQMGLRGVESEFGLEASVKSVGNKSLKQKISLGRVGKMFGLGK